MKPKLSILVPAIPGRLPRLCAILTRCMMSVRLYNLKFQDLKLKHQDVEFVIVDGGSTDETQKICAEVGKAFPVKYVYLPIGRFVDANYPRNCGLRVCEGEVLCHLDVDHYPSENIIEGVLRPFLDGRIDKHINRGYVLDTSRSKHPAFLKHGHKWLEDSVHAYVLSQEGIHCQIADFYEKAMIPSPGVNSGTLWIWAAKREYVKDLDGYDETYCRQDHYGRDEDCFRQRLLKNGLKMWDGSNKLFCAIHLYHDAPHRKNTQNEFNKKYFKKVHGEGVINNEYAQARSWFIKANKNWPWGRMLKDGFSVINGIYREPSEHEKWIKENIPDVVSYCDEPHWDNIEHFWESLEVEIVAKQVIRQLEDLIK